MKRTLLIVAISLIVLLFANVFAEGGDVTGNGSKGQWSTLFEDNRDLVGPIITVLLSSLILPFFSPIIRMLDASRRRAEARQQLEDLKLVIEVDQLLNPKNPETIHKHYQSQFEAVVSEAKHLRRFRLVNSSEVSQKNQINPFNLWDIIAALAIPFLLFVVLVPYNSFTSNPDIVDLIAFSIITVVAGAISFTLAKWIICKYITSGGWQAFWQIIVSILALIPGLFVGVWVDSLIRPLFS